MAVLLINFDIIANAQVKNASFGVNGNNIFIYGRNRLFRYGLATVLDNKIGNLNDGNKNIKQVLLNSNITVNPYPITVFPNNSTTLSLASVINTYGKGTVSGSTVVNVLSDCKLPSAKLLGSQNIISGQSAELVVEFTGKSPWSFVLNGQSFNNIQTNPYKINVSPSITTNYSVTDLNNLCGFGNSSNTVQVTVLSAITCDITEPNNTIQDAYFLGNDRKYTFGNTNTYTLDLCIDNNNDEDWFQWNSNGKMYFIRVSLYSAGSNGYYKLIVTVNYNAVTITTAPIEGKQLFDSYIELFDSDGTTLLTYDNESGDEFYSSFTGAFSRISNSCVETMNVASPLNDITNGIQIKKANNTLVASNKIKPESSVQYSAGNSLLFTEGFVVDKGSTFETAIHTCANQFPTNGIIFEHATNNNSYNISPLFPEPLTGNDGIMVTDSRKYLDQSPTFYYKGRSGLNSSIEAINITTYTLSVWVKTNYNQVLEGKQYAIAQCRGATPGVGKSITMGYNTENGTWFIGAERDGTLNGIEYPFINHNEWMHIVGVWNGVSGSAITPEQFSLYINGKKIQSTDKIQIGPALIAPISGNGSIKIGYHEAWNTCFEGGIDDLRIYNRVLSVAEIQNIYFYEN